MIKELDPGDIYRLEPLFIEAISPESEEKCQKLLIGSASLADKFSPAVQGEIKKLMRSMNGYYSNLIEGNRTRPQDIQRALQKDFSPIGSRDLSTLHWAHLNTLDALENQIINNPQNKICTSEFLLNIHRLLYQDLPSAMRTQKNHKGEEFLVNPGELRDQNVTVGRLVPPPAASLPSFMNRFATYESRIGLRPQSIVSAMAAHHRFLWIHPFADGNGRVARLFTHAWLLKANLSGCTLWTMARGLARDREAYYAHLAEADRARASDYDGRGARSLKGLSAFCEYMIDVALDQVQFIHRLLQPDHFLERARRFIQMQSLPQGAANVYQQVLLQGEISRGDVATFSNKSPRAAQSLTSALIKEGYVASDSPKGKLQARFPDNSLAYLFPDLYPAES